MENRAIKKSIIIKAPAKEVWKAITDPEMAKKTFFGADLESDWKKGYPIIYSGIWKGKEFRDEGVILEIEKNKKLVHTHPGGTDNPQEFTVTYELEEKNDETILTVTQAGDMSKDSFEQSSQNWEMILQKIKEETEKVPVI